MSNITREKLHDIIGSIYDVAQQPTSAPWRDVYQRMADLFSSGPGGFMILDKGDSTIVVIESTYEPELMRLYQDIYSHHTPFHKKLASLALGERLNRKESLDDKAFRGLSIYDEFYKRAGVFHFECRTFLDYYSRNAVISFSRPDGKPNYSNTELKAMDFLMPHLARAFQFHFNLLSVQREYSMLAEALDRLPQGVIIVGREGKVVFSNSSGSDLMRQADGIRLDKDGRIVAALDREHRSLRNLINGIFKPSNADSNEFGGAMTISRPSEKRALELLISPFTGQQFGGNTSERFAVIFAIDPDARIVGLEKLLPALYGLTAAETAIAIKLVEGRSPTEICDDLKVSANTLRTHIKHIFSKTNTRRQSELVRLILISPPNIKSDDSYKNN